ncbi:hypothetical protein N7452_001560 [Penicillium brevicompactum]|uniref:Uncharacterized protein n=1 Tax=Penicillium brevicompactum TaxID=5074 RepID=A0A9W9URY1_PENBR|nr:hypothetical protein N7452_001560 [Penicillium brevicompactum]
MVSSKVFLLAVLSCAAPALAVEKPTLYSEAPCRGISQTIEPNENCTIVSADLKGKVSGATVPEALICNFYKDEKCEDPVIVGLEDPGVCDFDEFEATNKTVAVVCSKSETN